MKFLLMIAVAALVATLASATESATEWSVAQAFKIDDAASTDRAAGVRCVADCVQAYCDVMHTYAAASSYFAKVQSDLKLFVDDLRAVQAECTGNAWKQASAKAQRKLAALDDYKHAWGSLAKGCLRNADKCSQKLKLSAWTASFGDKKKKKKKKF